ncbi:hypothetical protein CAEBREN_24224 [Caenorhabditis brenneri]|uniref:SPK domain-containing protein n=1 Tax=Caenorhabditis brenneri TaxID=135651 RepID=G0NP93_CAEBE|nr:hypothetical protein CAEBREN_24224 [Caenorhabditis brenneri]
MNQRDQLLDQAEEVGKNNEETEKEEKESSGDEPNPKKVCVTVQELPEITVSEIDCLNISLEEIENFAKSSETAAALFASLSDDSMTGLSDQTETLSYEVLTTILYQIVRCYNILHPDNRVALFDFNMSKSDKDDIEGRIYFNEGGNCRRFILPVHTERRVEGSKLEEEHFALIYMDKADNGHILYADSARLFKFPDERIKSIAKILGMPNAAVEKLDPERVQIQSLTNSCGVHVAANCFAFLEYGIGFPRIRVDATNIRQQIVKFVRGVNYVKERFSIQLGVKINWMEPKAIKIPKEFEEFVESQQAPRSSARRARNPVPTSAQPSEIRGQSTENSDVSTTLGATKLPAIQRASKRIRQKRMPANPPAPQGGIGGSVDPAWLVSHARVLGQKVMDEGLGGLAPESGIGDVGDLEWLLRNGSQLAQFFVAQGLGRPEALGPGASDIQPISQGDVMDASKVPAKEEDLEPASDSIGDAQIVQEESLEYQVEMTELEETKAFLDYVHRHCLTAVQPIIRMELCRRFVKESKSDTDPEELYQRARRVPVELEDMDPVERARVHFTLSIPVEDYGFLDRLSETGDVDLDNKQRIIKFWSYDGSVKLQGAPVAHPDQGAPNRAGAVSVGAQNAAQGAASVQEVVEHARRTESPVATNEAQHSRLGGQPADASEALRAREGDDVPGLSMSTLPPTQLIPTGLGTRTSSLSPAAQGEQSTSGAPMLGAHTPVAHPDQGAPIGENRAGTVSVGAQGRPGAPKPEGSDIQPISQGDVVDVSKVSASKGGKTSDLEPASNSIGDARIVQEEMLEHQVEMTELDKEKRAEEVRAFVAYQEEEIQKSDKPTCHVDFARRFVELHGLTTDPRALSNRARNYAPKLESMDPIMRMRRCFVLSQPVKEDFVATLFDKAVIELDDNRRIIKYSAKDGSLNLEGSHDRKSKIGYKAPRKRSRKAGSSGSGEKEEEEEEEKEEDDRFRMSSLPPAQLSPTRMGAGTSNLVESILSPTAKGPSRSGSMAPTHGPSSSSSSGALLLGAHNLAHPIVGQNRATKTTVLASVEEHTEVARTTENASAPAIGAQNSVPGVNAVAQKGLGDQNVEPVDQIPPEAPNRLDPELLIEPLSGVIGGDVQAYGANNFMARALGALGSPEPEASNSQLVPQGDVVDGSKVPAHEEGDTSLSGSNSKTNNLEPDSESIGDTQIVQEKILEGQLKAPVQLVTHDSSLKTKDSDLAKQSIEEEQIVNEDLLDKQKKAPVQLVTHDSSLKTKDSDLAKQSSEDVQIVNEDLLDKQKKTPVQLVTHDSSLKTKDSDLAKQSIEEVQIVNEDLLDKQKNSPTDEPAPPAPSSRVSSNVPKTASAGEPENPMEAATNKDDELSSAVPKKRNLEDQAEKLKKMAYTSYSHHLRLINLIESFPKNQQPEAYQSLAVPITTAQKIAHRMNEDRRGRMEEESIDHQSFATPITASSEASYQNALAQHHDLFNLIDRLPYADQMWVHELLSPLLERAQESLKDKLNIIKLKAEGASKKLGSMREEAEDTRKKRTGDKNQSPSQPAAKKPKP